MPTFIHPLSDVAPHSRIGEDTRIWQYVVVLDGARVGSGCNLCSHVFVESDVVIGDRVTVKNGVQLWNGLRVGNDVFIGPNACFTNDPFPRSGDHSKPLPITQIRDGASIGAHATILPGLVIGEQAMIGAGAVVTHSVPPRAIVRGNPARVVGYVGTTHADPVVDNRDDPAGPQVQATQVQGVTLHRLPCIRDIRGSLSVGEFERSVPFAPRRFFTVFDVPSAETRGEHAHHRCLQFLVCLKGSLSVIADDGRIRQEFCLDRPSTGLFIPAMTWAIQYKYSTDAVLAVFASDHYDPDDYIRDYAEFLRKTKAAA